LTTTEIGRISAPLGTISFTSASGTIDVNSAVSFGAGTAAGVVLDSGSLINIGMAGSLASPGSVLLRSANLNLLGPVTANAGAATLVGASMVLNAAVNTPAGDINISPFALRDIDLGGAGNAGAIGLDNTELGNLSPSGILRIGDADGFTRNINLSGAITLPGRVVSLT
jgi:hypothetical protein